MLSMMLNEVAPPPPPPPPPEPAVTTPPPRFSTYLLPSLSRPFRRHRRALSSSNAIPAPGDIPPLSNSPTDSILSSLGDCPPDSSSSSPPSWFSHVKHGFRRPSTEQHDVPKLTRIQPDTIRCSTCGTDFAFYSQIVSKGFTGRYGRAYLISPPDGPPQKSGANLMNIKIGKPESRILATGTHLVSDILCATCRTKVGWKYVDAKEESQKYKIGKFILETQRTVNYRSWEDTMGDEIPELEFGQKTTHDGDDAEPVVFDSDDEDECEDLFTGVWDAKVAAKRRELKRNRRFK